VSVKRYTDMQLLTSRQVLLLLRPQSLIIRTLALRHDGKMARLSRDVRIKARKDFYFTPEMEIAAIEMLFIRVRRLSMKDLTNFLHYQVKYCNILKIIVLNIS
jgi:hypothetical protein